MSDMRWMLMAGRMSVRSRSVKLPRVGMVEGTEPRVHCKGSAVALSFSTRMLLGKLAPVKAEGRDDDDDDDDVCVVLLPRFPGFLLPAALLKVDPRERSGEEEPVLLLKVSALPQYLHVCLPSPTSILFSSGALTLASFSLNTHTAHAPPSSRVGSRAMGCDRRSREAGAGVSSRWIGVAVWGWETKETY